MPARRKQSEGHTPEERTRADLRVVPPFPKVERQVSDTVDVQRINPERQQSV